MASITIIGSINKVHFLPNGNGCMLFLTEFKKGYKRNNGERVDDKFIQWKCVCKQGLVNYINNHFSEGMVVEVKGEVFPYAIEHEQIVEGTTVILQTLNMFSIPKTYMRAEQQMLKDSQLHSSGSPNLEEYNSPDF